MAKRGWEACIVKVGKWSEVIQECPAIFGAFPEELGSQKLNRCHHKPVACLTNSKSEVYGAQRVCFREFITDSQIGAKREKDP